MVHLMRWWLCALAVGSTAGCSRDYDSPLLGISWTPPAGTRLVEEAPGPVPHATFDDGAAWYRLGAAFPLDEATLKDQLPNVLAAAGVAAGGSVGSAKLGTLPAGSVARYELSGGGGHTLVYVIPQGAGTLLLLFRAPSARYGSASAALERSLAQLRLR
jgi:hypothetical protein